MTEPLIVASLVALVATLSSAVIGGLFYLWRKDPMRNGTIAKLTEAILEMGHISERLNQAHDDYLHRMDEQDKRNREEHTAMMNALRELTDIVAPRRKGGR